MSSAICFNLDQSKILSSGNGLMLCTHGSIKSNLSNNLMKKGYIFLSHVESKKSYNSFGYCQPSETVQDDID